MSLLIGISSLLLLLAFSYYLTGRFRQFAIEKNVIDIPNARSSHTQIKPRGAGIIFVSLTLVTAMVALSLHLIDRHEAWVIVPSTLAIAAVSFLDDWRGVSTKIRFLVQILAATNCVLALGGVPDWLFTVSSVHLGVRGSILAIYGIVWSINLFNFMDGTDGIAATEALFVFAIGGWVTWHAGGHEIAWLCYAVCALIIGFLAWNWPNSKVFMGDVGSAFLGCLIVIVALLAQQLYQVPFTVWLIAYSAFWFDASVTIIRRFLAKQPIYQAHRSHAYQRLCQSGYSHQQLLFVVIFLNTILAILAINSFYSPQYILDNLFIALCLCTTYYVWVERRFPKSLADKHQAEKMQEMAT